MKSIKKEINHELIIKKSTFITEIKKIYSKSSVKDELAKIKEKYKDANHYCYAYIIDDERKSSDDGEPGGTAGLPIMETLNQYDLNYVLCVVIRYFGGIKLGAGGLVRAYRKSVLEAIKEGELVSLIKGYKITVKSSYSKQKELENILSSSYTKIYDEMVIYETKCTQEEKEEIEKRFDILELKDAYIEI